MSEEKKKKSSSTAKKPSSSTDKKSSSTTDKKSSSTTDKKKSSHHKTSTSTPKEDKVGAAPAENSQQHEQQIKKLNDDHVAEVSKLNATIQELEGKLAGLQADVKKVEAELSAAKKKDSSSSSDDGAVDALKAEVSQLEAKASGQEAKIAELQQQLNAAQAQAAQSAATQQAAEQAKAQLAEQTAKVDSLEHQLANVVDQNNKANADLQAEVNKLHQKIQALEAAATNVASPRGGFGGNKPQQQGGAAAASDGPMPAWKVRQMEKEKEEEEKRAAEQKAKLTKVTSIKIKTGEVTHNPDRPTFKDPLLAKAPVADNNVVDDAPIGASALLGGGKTVEELEAEEEARIMKNFGRAKK